MIPPMMRHPCRRPFWGLLSVFFVLAACSRADVTLPALLADHMLVQRGLPVHIWGMAAPAESVSATFRNETRTAVADQLGRWSLYFSPGEAGGPFQMTIRANNTLTLTDILVGEVWVGSGQSNMELSNAVNHDEEIAAVYPLIHLFHVKKSVPSTRRGCGGIVAGLHARKRSRGFPPSSISSRAISACTCPWG